MGLAGQFCNLVDGYAEIADLLEMMKHKATSKPFNLEPGSPGLAAFKELRAALVRMPALIIPDFN